MNELIATLSFIGGISVGAGLCTAYWSSRFHQLLADTRELRLKTDDVCDAVRAHNDRGGAW